METNKKDFIFLRTGWNEAIREVLNILNKKYYNYTNMDSVKKDIGKLLDYYGDYEQLEITCELYKYYSYDNADFGFLILNCIDRIEGYCLNIKEKTFTELSQTDCLFDINNLEPMYYHEFKNQKEALEELNKILSKFKKAEN